MQLNDLPTQAGEWLKGTGPESDIVMSCRIRLARNLVDFPFTNRATEQQKSEAADLLRDAIVRQDLGTGVEYFDLNNIGELDRHMRVERHLISKELCEAGGSRGVAVGSDEILSIMVNEEDHLRIQVLRSGLQLAEAWKMVDHVDDVLDRAGRSGPVVEVPRGLVVERDLPAGADGRSDHVTEGPAGREGAHEEYQDGPVHFCPPLQYPIVAAFLRRPRRGNPCNWIERKCASWVR